MKLLHVNGAVTGLALIGALFLPRLTVCAEEVNAGPAAPPPLFSGDFGVTVANEYNTRGIIVQNHGATFQPYLDVFAKTYEGAGLINKISLQLDLWSDLSTDDRVAWPGNTQRHFTEFDYAFGFNVKFARHFTFTSVWNKYVSPANGYPDGQFINNTLSFDDTGTFDPHFAFHPYLTFLYELPDDGQAGLKPKAWYFEPGIHPSYTFAQGSATPLTFSWVAKFGLGEKFYAGKTFGYFATGPQLSTTLASLQKRYGTWTISVGYLHYYLGRTVAAIAPRGSRQQHLVSLSTGVSF